MEKKTIKKSFRFTKNEWQLIEKKCIEASITSTQYFQQIAISGETAKQDCLKEKQMYIGEIAMIGNDIYYLVRMLKINERVDRLMLQILLKVEKKLNGEWLF